MNWPTLPISLGPVMCLALCFTSIQVQAQTPVISALSKGSAQPGDSITITGSNFATSASDNIVSFGAEHATVLSASSVQLQVQVPPGTPLLL